MSAENILSIKNLEIQNNFGVSLVKDISLNIKKKEIVCITGQSGVGKTITSLAIMNLLPISLKIVNGEISLNGRIIHPKGQEDIDSLRGVFVSMVFQNPKDSINPLLTIGRQLEDILNLHKPHLAQKNRKRIVEEALRDIGFNDVRRIYNSYVQELSGGQLQRCLLTPILLNNTRLLIADEPTSSLDVVSRDQILHLFKRLNQEIGLTVIIISHDKYISEMTDRVIEFGDIIPSGPFINKENVLVLDRKLKKKDSQKTNAILRINNLTKKYPDNHNLLSYKKSSYIYALKDFSMELYAGEILGITGPSGSGKTTLANCIVGLTKWDEGKIEINGESIKQQEGPQRCAKYKIQMIWQHPYSSLNPVMSVRAIISQNLRKSKNLSTKNYTNLISNFLKNVELADTLLEHKPTELSGGQCQRVAIASILALNPRILIADEALSYLDYKNKLGILRLLHQLRDEFNLSIIFISHDREIIGRMCDRTIDLTITNAISI